MLGGTAEDRDELVVAERLLDVVEGASVHRLHRGLQRRLRGHQDHRDVGIVRPRRGEHLNPGHLRHPHIGEHDVGGQLHDALERLLPPVRQLRREPFRSEQDLECLQDA